jgi:chromosome partitioning protein
MVRIAIANQKGGVGKTTLGVHIAMAWAQRGPRVLLVDADPQSSALDWSASRSDAGVFPVIGLPKATLHREIKPLAQDFDSVIIDGPPRAYDVARSAIMASDIIVIPIQPSPYDVWAAKEIIDLIKEASSFKEKLKCAFAINRKIVNTAIGRDVHRALEDYDVPVLKTSVCQRVIFAESAASGQTVLEAQPESRASQEIRSLAYDIIEMQKH